MSLRQRYDWARTNLAHLLNDTTEQQYTPQERSIAIKAQTQIVSVLRASVEFEQSHQLTS